MSPALRPIPSRLSRRHLELRWQLPVAFPGRTQTGAGEAVSTEVHSIAANSAGVWIDTGNGAGSVLAYADPQNKKWVVPRYQDDVAFDLRDVDLASAGDLIQGAETGSTPANMYLFYPDHYVLLDGHKYDEVGCASGAAQSSSARLYLVNCDGILLTGEIQQTNFKVAARIGTLPEWPASNTSSWTTWVMTAGRNSRSPPTWSIRTQPTQRRAGALKSMEESQGRFRN